MTLHRMGDFHCLKKLYQELKEGLQLTNRQVTPLSHLVFSLNYTKNPIGNIRKFKLLRR